jgi:hypothetical protein
MQCEERDHLMDIYLAAAYKDEEAQKNPDKMKIKGCWK